MMADPVRLALAHMAGDYVVQSDWMAQEKVKRWPPALAHAASYAACHLILTRDPVALCIIGGTHAVIDRYRLARHVVWAKNQLAPRSWRYPWSQGKATGYHEDRPPWMAVWLMIAADNTLHLAINAAATEWAGNRSSSRRTLRVGGQWPTLTRST
jgi:hypothetical protein